MVLEEEEVLNPGDRDRFPMVRVVMVPEEDLEVIPYCVTIVINRDTWLGIALKERVI